MRKYYRNKKTKEELTLDMTIANGVLLTKFNETQGYPYGNDYYKVFVTKSDLEKKWELFQFKFPVEESDKREIKTIFHKIFYELKNYGIEEDKINAFNEVDNSFNSLINEMVDRYRGERMGKEFTFSDWWDSVTRDKSDNFEFDAESAGEIAAFVDSLYEPLQRFAVAIRENTLNSINPEIKVEK